MASNQRPYSQEKLNKVIPFKICKKLCLIYADFQLSNSHNRALCEFSKHSGVADYFCLHYLNLSPFENWHFEYDYFLGNSE